MGMGWDLPMALSSPRRARTASATDKGELPSKQRGIRQALWSLFRQVMFWQGAWDRKAADGASCHGGRNPVKLKSLMQHGKSALVPDRVGRYHVARRIQHGDLAG